MEGGGRAGIINTCPLEFLQLQCTCISIALLLTHADLSLSCMPAPPTQKERKGLINNVPSACPQVEYINYE